jgi:L-seryl-tRNA(Ser) seleniumtransferase
MAPSEQQKELLRRLPGVDRLLELVGSQSFSADMPRQVLTRSIRQVLDDLRRRIVENEHRPEASQLSEPALMDRIRRQAERTMALNLIPTINATGIVIHTNLGRSLLAEEAAAHVSEISRRYSNLEFDLAKGRRGSRYSNVEGIICEISGAESAVAVNNNAGAVLLALDTLAHGRKVIVSRGELVEIGGSFRIPDVMAKSGGILCEVGTTNRTHLEDYENAADETAALLLKVHKSNYSVVGFTAEVSLNDLVRLGRKHNVPVMEDLGSGNFIDFTKYGLPKEPTVQESVAAGADIITFSGDKLLGGPQAGLIVGRRELIDRIKKNPLTRALRIDKMTLAALESTLRLYRDESRAVKAIPTLRMMLQPIEEIAAKASRLRNLLQEIDDHRLTVEVLDLPSRPGGGSLPLLKLPSKCLGVRVAKLSVNAVERWLRSYATPIIGRIEADTYIMDLRTVLPDELDTIRKAFEHLLERA